MFLPAHLTFRHFITISVLIISSLMSISSSSTVTRFLRTFFAFLKEFEETVFEHTTRFFFSFNDDSDQFCEHDSIETSSWQQEARKQNSNTDEDGDVMIPDPDESSHGKRVKEVITIEHKFQTILKDVGFQVWLGSLLLCDYLIDCRDNLCDHSVLDLGSGTGLTSIVAAMFAKSVICSDYTQEIVNLAEKNWKRNSDMLPSSSLKQNVTFQILDWTNHQLHSDTDEDDLSLYDASLIVAAEVIYDDDLTDAFFQTIYYLLKRPPSKTVIMSVEKRIVFDSAWRDVCSPAYLHFQENMNDLCSVDEGPVRFECQQIPTESVDQYFVYDRTNQLELWKIMSSFEIKKTT